MGIRQFWVLVAVGAIGMTSVTGVGAALAAEEGERKRPASAQRIVLQSDASVVGQRSSLLGTVEARARDARTGSWSLPRGARLDLIALGADSGEEARETGDARPPIVSRAGWGADEKPLPPGAELGDPSTVPEGNADVKAVFVHHTAGTNDYGCAESPAISRAIHEFHVRVNGWKDLGCNFLVDKCGTVFEGRKGGIDKPVMGAHTLGFNRESSGVAVLGNHVAVPASQETSAAADPAGTATLPASATQTNYFKQPFEAGDSYAFSRISSHRDGVHTECAGDRLCDQLPLIRQHASDFTDHTQPTHNASRTPPG
ncbi:N-acetylmuramoyl-L-alanine amidase [Streptomyces sp. NPDC091376]|uniref:N-acetylmuramoyl-L-alanine amidase n=1 Tax=Streptomyces sp. NPDC091376 TaxID=3365994 RepID=UPI0037F2E282